MSQTFNQKGFSAVAGIIIGLIIVAAIGVGGALIIKNQKTQPAQEEIPLVSGDVEEPPINFDGKNVIDLFERLKLNWKTGLEGTALRSIATACNPNEQYLIDSLEAKINAGERRDFLVNGVMPLTVTPSYGGFPDICREHRIELLAEYQGLSFWSTGCGTGPWSPDERKKACLKTLQAIKDYENIQVEGAY